MNAGEAVFQGREGTGLAQILNYQDARPIQVPYNLMAQNAYRAEQIRRARRAEDDKKIADFAKFDKGYDYFNPNHARDINALNKSIENDLNQGIPLEQSIAKNRELKNAITEQTQKGLSAAEVYKRKLAQLKETPNVDMQRATPFLNDYLFPPKDENGFVPSFDSIDENTASKVDLHPSTYDAQGDVLGSANKIKNQIELGELNPEMFRGNNGAYFTKHLDKWRFRVDPQTGRIANDVIKFYADKPKIYDRILWDDIAKKNGVLDDNRIMPEERNLVDKIFMEQKNKPENAPIVMNQIENWLNQIQGEAHRTDAVGAGRDRYDIAFGSGGNQIVPNIQKDPNLFQYSNLEEAEKQQGISSHGDGSVPYNSDKMSNIEGVYPGKKATFVGTKIDPKTGKPVALFTDDKGFNLEPKPFDQDMRARLNNVAKSKGESVNIQKVFEETDKIAKTGNKMVVNEPELNQKADEFEKLLLNKEKANDNKDEYTSDIQQFLKDNGIDAEVSVNRNYGAQWFNGGPFVKIKDKQFDLSKEVDKKQLKSLLFDSAPARFSTKQITPQEFQSQWIKLEPGQSLMGPDGKIYKKK